MVQHSHSTNNNTLRLNRKCEIQDGGLKPPSWILHFRFNFALPHPRKHGSSRWNFTSISSTSWDLGISGFTAAIFYFWLPLTPHSVRIAVFEFHIIENMGIIAVEITIISHLQAEIWDISGFTAAILDFWLPLTSHSFRLWNSHSRNYGYSKNERWMMLRWMIAKMIIWDEITSQVEVNAEDIRPSVV